VQPKRVPEILRVTKPLQLSEWITQLSHWNSEPATTQAASLALLPTRYLANDRKRMWVKNSDLTASGNAKHSPFIFVSKSPFPDSGEWRVLEDAGLCWPFADQKAANEEAARYWGSPQRRCSQRAGARAWLRAQRAAMVFSLQPAP
jgi:hypothetical protein